MMLGIKPKASCMLGMYFTPEPHPGSLHMFLENQNLVLVLFLIKMIHYCIFFSFILDFEKKFTSSLYFVNITEKSKEVFLPEKRKQSSDTDICELFLYQI
jgi:hypothetical protein